MKIPVLCLSGGKLSEFDNIGEWRVWCHPENGEDYCYRFAPTKFIQALWKRKELLSNDDISFVEPVCAVVYDSKFGRYREVVIDIG